MLHNIIPRDIRNKLVEMHGKPDIGKTGAALKYIEQRQKEDPNFLVCYIDLSQKLQDSGFFAELNKEKVWIVYDIEGLEGVTLLGKASKEADLIVVDDITLYRGNLWKLLSNMSLLAREGRSGFLLISQKRNIRIPGTERFEEAPYRYNAIQRYCDMAIDLDTKEIVFKKQGQTGEDPILAGLWQDFACRKENLLRK